MRQAFIRWIAKELLDPNVWLLYPDVGYGYTEGLKGNIINTGISEELCMNMAVGLALAGKKVYIYSIATFLIYGAFEQIRNYMVNLGLDITIIGVGRDMTYKNMDYSHWAIEEEAILDTLEGNIKVYEPEDEKDMIPCLEASKSNGGPAYVRCI